MTKARRAVGDLLDVDTDFERLHPRGEGGRFVEVALRLQAMGAKWEVPGVRRHEGADAGIKSLEGEVDEERGIWLVPVERRAELDALMAEAGYSVVDVPEGMRPAKPEDREKFKWPPAWTDVFVATDPKADKIMQGRDGAGRSQRIYSDKYHFHQNEKKHVRVRRLEERWPEVSAQMEDDSVSDPAAAALMLSARMGFRPGSVRDTKAKKQAYGASTIERRHVKVTGDTVRVRMTTKGGRKTDLSIVDPALARMIERYSRGKTGKDRLFDTNENQMLRWMGENAGEGFKTKDLRTRFASAHARQLVAELPAPTTRKEYQRQRNFVGDQVSERLGNTRKMALSSYIDRAVFMDWENSETVEPAAVKTTLSYFDNLEDRKREIARFGLEDWPTKGEASQEILGDAKDTQTLHAVGRTDTGRTIYSAERKQHHDQWVGEEIGPALREALGSDDPAVDKLMRGEALTGQETLELRARVEASRAGDRPTALFMAGGPASGKTSSLKNEPALKPPAAVEINADDLKEKIPEFGRIKNRRDKYAAVAAHEESSDLAKRIQQEALALGLNVVIDGTGNGSTEKFVPKVTDMIDADYEVDMLYVTVPAEEAVVRSTLRAMGEGRWVPTPELRKSHRRVSANFLEILALDGVRDLKLYDNARGEGGPHKIAEYVNGKLVIYDQVAYDSYIEKMNEKG